MKTQFEIIQEQLDDERPLIIEGTVRKHKVPRTFILAFIKEYNVKYNTLYLDTKKVQTYRGKTRSAGDIYLITKQYFPKITYERVFKILMSFPSLVGHFCTTINKQVYKLKELDDYWHLYITETDHYDDDEEETIICKQGHDEHGVNLQPYFEKLKYFMNPYD